MDGLTSIFGIAGAVIFGVINCLMIAMDPNGGQTGNMVTPPSPAGAFVKGALLGAIVFGGGTALVGHFTATAQSQSAFLADCMKAAPAGAATVSLITLSDGRTGCSYSTSSTVQTPKRPGQAGAAGKPTARPSP